MNLKLGKHVENIYRFSIVDNKSVCVYSLASGNFIFQTYVEH